MKIQCPCGAKYAFDVTEEMVAHPITFVCPQCNVDSSAVVNQLIREMFPTVVVVPPPAAGPAPVQPAPARPAIRVNVPSQPHAAPPAAPLRVAGPTAPAHAAQPAATDSPKPCLKHLGQLAVEHCVVCQKPICPKCMEMFGYVCSAFCKGKAENERIYVPAFAGQKAVAEARYWRKSGLIAGAITLVIAGMLGGWAWYKFYASVPNVKFSVKLQERAYSGACRIVGENQLVFLHGGLLARHDLKAKKEVWSRQLIDRDKIARDAEQALKDMEEARKKAVEHGAEFYKALPPLKEIKENLLRSAEAALELHVDAGYVWVTSSEKLVKYDWQTGQPVKEIALDDRYYQTSRSGDELVLVAHGFGGEEVTRRVNLQSGDSQVQEKSNAALAVGGARAPKPGVEAGKAALVARAGDPGQKPMNPAAVAAVAQNLPLPSRIALPAVLAANANQQRLAAAMQEYQPPKDLARDPAKGQQFERVSEINDPAGKVEFAVALLEEKTVAREAMKAPPKRSVFEGDMRVTETAAIANEILNDMQRDHTEGVEFEDASLYSVRVRRGSAEWTNQVVGSPSFFPLKSYDVVAASKRIFVLDKQAKKLWESPLNFEISAALWTGPGEEPSRYGAGPAIERGDMLFIIDKGVLTAFEAATGNARWRLPSVGIAGVLFDDENMMYVNTTTASPEKIRFSQQIDVSDRTHNQILKVDPATGKTLWSNTHEGMINYLSGKFIYTVDYHEGDELEGNPLAGIPGATTAPHVRIKRLNPKTGEVMWEHYQRRAPVDIQIDKNTIQLLFRKEMQVLKYISL
jgi:hypothetical protein